MFAALVIIELTSLAAPLVRKTPDTTHIIVRGPNGRLLGISLRLNGKHCRSRGLIREFPFPVASALFGAEARLGWLSTLTLGLSWSSIGGHLLPRIATSVTIQFYVHLY
jgi:hypothetical protein